MACEAHKKLAEYIKSVHKALRIEAKKVGSIEAWRNHCQQDETLKLYAAAMHELATVYWENDSKKLNNSRICWIVNQSLKYFSDGGKYKEQCRELGRIKKQIPCEDTVCSQIYEDVNNLSLCKLTLLDVGSCYNPFKKYPFFNILPIDLKPACNDVYEADFLSLPTSDETWNMENLTTNVPLTFLPRNYFDIIVFSLLLEYMPSCQQRFTCCKKAFSLLKPEGLLFIITPDSKHATANSSLMKNWRICLSQIGFTRIVYEKLPHIHCMVFRKNCFSVISQTWAETQFKKLSKPVSILSDPIQLCELLQIPQDETEYDNNEQTENFVRSEQDNFVSAEMFRELPEVMDL